MSTSSQYLFNPPQTSIHSSSPYESTYHKKIGRDSDKLIFNKNVQFKNAEDYENTVQNMIIQLISIIPDKIKLLEYIQEGYRQQTNNNLQISTVNSE